MTHVPYFIQSSASSRVVNQLLTEMDGLVARRQVFIMGATNRPGKAGQLGPWCHGVNGVSLQILLTQLCSDLEGWTGYSMWVCLLLETEKPFSKPSLK